mmetsp:Transcript_53422/g.87866  ORF Transcript_53422/g.87866 Transcript_53422/m.87866 type:complete len:234 (+) Transcript_53422:2053-2754(+)
MHSAPVIWTSPRDAKWQALSTQRTPARPVRAASSWNVPVLVKFVPSRRSKPPPVRRCPEFVKSHFRNSFSFGPSRLMKPLEVQRPEMLPERNLSVPVSRNTASPSTSREASSSRISCPSRTRPPLPTIMGTCSNSEVSSPPRRVNELHHAMLAWTRFTAPLSITTVSAVPGTSGGSQFSFVSQLLSSGAPPVQRRSVQAAGASARQRRSRVCLHVHHVDIPEGWSQRTRNEKK